MAITSASIPVGATFSPSGGSATSLVPLSVSQNTGKFLLSDSAAYSLRTTLNVSNVEPRAKADAPSGYTQRRARVNIQKPMQTVAGRFTTNSITIELSCDIEAVDTDVTALRSLAMNALNDADFAALWNSSAIS